MSWLKSLLLLFLQNSEEGCWSGRSLIDQGNKLCRTRAERKVNVFFFTPMQIKINQGKSSPSTPILPSPSESPAARKALVSASVRALAVAQKFCRNSLEKKDFLATKATVTQMFSNVLVTSEKNMSFLQIGFSVNFFGVISVKVLQYQKRSSQPCSLKFTLS